MPDVPKIERAHVMSWLSEPRYDKYPEATREDDAVALNLYLWNIGLAQAVLKDVSFFEAALRSAYDRAISSTWFGGFLFAFLPGKTAQLFSYAPTGRYGGALDGTGIMEQPPENRRLFARKRQFT